MWRIVNGFLRGIRGRTPAPPSQTSPHSEENECGGNAPTNITIGNCDPKEQSCQTVSEASITLLAPKQESENANEIVQRILGEPSEADILLQEFFGPSWKRRTTDNNQKKHGSGDIAEHIFNGFSLGTAWMTAMLLGRVVFSTWRNHARRKEISHDNISSFYEFEERYINKMRERCYPSNPSVLERPRCWNAIFHVLPSSRNAILAAGGDIVDSKNSFRDVSTDKQFSIKIAKSVPKYNIPNDTNLPKQQKSVTFEEDFFESEGKFQDTDRESSDEVSEEAIEQFTEDARNCSGATFNILGLQSIKSGKRVEAFQRFQLGSKEGYSKAHFNLALCYEKGFGTKKDKSKAMELYEKAAFKGHTKAQYNLALLLLEKDDTAHKLHAIRLLEKAATNGFVQAQSYLGAYLAKPGEFHDMKKAVKMFKKAAEQGDTKSKYHLGICHERGLGGLKQDLSKAFDLYSSAATTGHLDAQYNMAVMLQKGFDETDKNPMLSEEILRKAAKLGHKPSSRRLKEMKVSKNVTSCREMKTSANQPYKVYYSEGKPAESRQTKVSNQPCQTISEKETKCLQHFPGTGLNHARSILMPSMLSQHVSNISLIGRLQVPPPDNGQRGTVQQEFELAMGLANDPVTDAVQDLLGLRRVSTTPANLCYHSPMINEPLNAFSLEV